MKNLIQIFIAFGIALSAIVSFENNPRYTPTENYISMDQTYTFENTNSEDILF